MAQTPLELATSMVGKREGPERAALTEYLKNGGVNLDPATTAWCAAFVNATLKQSGMTGTGSNLARSFSSYGTDSRGNPQAGDIAVFPRGKDPTFGHVGFIQSYDPKTGQIQLLAGNQGNAVSVSPYNINNAVAIRHPGEAVPQDGSVNLFGTPPAPGPQSPQEAADAAGHPKPLAAAPNQGGEGPSPMQGPPMPSRDQLAAMKAKKPTWQDRMTKFAEGFGKGLGGMSDSAGSQTPASAYASTQQMSPVPVISSLNEQAVADQRQQLALAMARLNSGKLYA